MKIFQVVPYYPPHIGGMEFYVQSISEELALRGHEVTVFTSSEKPYIQRINGVNVNSLKQSTKVYNIPVSFDLFLKLAKEEKPDLIHAHQYPVFYSDIAALVSTIKCIPFILHVHVVSEPKSPLSGALSTLYYSTIGRGIFCTAKKIITPSEAYKRKIIALGVNEEKIKVIPGGIDLAEFSKKADNTFKVRYNCEGSKIILSVGRLNYQKGFQYLIKAMLAVLKQIPNAKLIIVGDGEQFDFLNNLTKSLGLNNSIVFTGPLSSEDLAKAYSIADLFVLPSIFESFGIALVEAQAAGKPVIGSRTGGVPEAMVDGQTGLLVQPGNVSELQEAIIQLLSNEQLMFEMGRRGQLFVSNRFSIKTAVDELIDQYSHVLSS